MKNKYFIGSLGILLAICALSFYPGIASADQGQIVVTVTSELGYPLANAGITFLCTSGATTIVGKTGTDGTLTVASSSLQAAAAFANANCGGVNGTAITIVATSTGFIASSTVSVTSTTNTFTVGNMKYGLRVVAMKRESDASSVMPTNVYGIPFSVSGNLSLASTSYSEAATIYNSAAAAWYLAASSTSSGGTLTATSSGYANNSTTTVTTSLSAQKTVAFDGGTSYDINSTNAFKFLLKVVTNDELGSGVSSVTVTHGGTAETLASSANHYFTTTTAGAIAASKSGYVTFDTSTEDTGLASVSTSASGQTVVTLSGTTAYTSSDPVATSVTGRGLRFALKVTATDASTGLALTGARVLAGAGGAISCSESGSTGVYYCIIPITDSGTQAEVTKSGYNPVVATYTVRSAATTPQRTATSTLASSTSSGTTVTRSSGGSAYSVPLNTVLNSPAVVPGCPAGMTCKAISVGLTRASMVNGGFTQRIAQGAQSASVKALQAILNSDPDTRISATGAGSPGNETTYFGPMTLKAIQKFQVKYNIAKPGDDGYGTVGPKTRAKLNTLIH